jgi:plasmid stability protein
MKSISLRNVPDDVYEALKAMSMSSHRSLQEQIKYILEQEVRLRRGSPVSNAAKWRRRLKDRIHSDSVELIRGDRQR